MKIIKRFKNTLIIFELLYSLFFIGTIIFLVILKRDDNESSQNLKNLNYNWRQKPIIDIIALNMNSDCPDEYENMFEIRFPGLSSGCQCNGTSLSSSKYGMCNFEQIYKGCRNINSKGGLKITNYKNKTLCVKRMKQNYLELSENVYKMNENCPNNTKRCGKFDSLENDICLPENECPITEIIFTNQDNPIYSGYNKIILHQNINNLFQDYFLFFSNKNYNKLHSSIILTGVENNKKSLCADKEFRNYFTFNDCKFTNFYNVTNSQCPLTDKNYGVEIDEISGYQFYLNNHITSKYFDKIYDCNENSNFNNKLLFSSNYHGIKKKCDKVSTNNFINIVLSSESVVSNLISYLELLEFSIILVYFVLSVIIKWNLIVKYNLKKINTVYLLELISSILFFLIGLYLFIEYILINSNVNDVNYFKENKCGDEYANDLAIQMSYYNENILRELKMAFLFIFVGSLVYPCKIIYFYYQLRGYGKNKINNNKNENLIKDFEQENIINYNSDSTSKEIFSQNQ